MRHSKKATLIAKLLLGIGLCYYFFHQKLLDPKVILEITLSPIPLFLCTVVNFIFAYFAAYRWKLIARVHHHELPLRRHFSLLMIGYFFGTFLPALGADAVRATYSAFHQKDRKWYSYISVFFERGLAVFTGFFIVCISWLFWIGKRDPRLHSVFLISLTVTVVLFLAAILSINLVPKLTSYKKNLSVLFRCFLLSILLNLINTVLYLIPLWWMGLSIAFSNLVFITVLGSLAMTIPFLPLGFGLGQLAFFHLFNFAGLDPEKGMLLCTLYQGYTLLFNLLGIFYFLSDKRRSASPS